jgi:dolichol-phosphate mannosyltransferase
MRQTAFPAARFESAVRPEPDRRPLISYVVPVYYEQDGIAAFHTELTEALDGRPEFDFELVYVNDGSQDASLAILKDLAKNDPCVRVVDFARNFGAHRPPGPTAGQP